MAIARRKTRGQSFVDGLARVIDLPGARSRLHALASADPFDVSEMADDWRAVAGDFVVSEHRLLYK